MSQPNPPPEKPAHAGVFITTITAMNDGKVVADLDDAIREATKSALAASAKAKISLELTVIPNGTGVGDTPLIKIVDKIKVTAPKPARDKQPVFFADEEGNPTRRNPIQEEIKFTAIEGGSQPQGMAAAAKAQASNQ